jgi:phosphate uptake regulator
MKRNVVAQGPSTLMVSLPSKWVKKYGISKGDQVDMLEDGRKMILSTESVDTEINVKTIKLLDNNSYYIWTEILPQFIAGYDEICVENIDKVSMEFIENEAIKSMMGFDISHQTSKFVVLKKVMKEDSSEFDTIMRRVFLGLVEQSKILLNFFESEEDLDFILTLERTNNRQCNYLKRLLTKEGFYKQDKIVFVSILTEYLLAFADGFKYLVWTIRKENMLDFDNKIVEICKKLHEKLELNYKLYFNYSHELFETVENETIRLDSKTGQVIDYLDLNPKAMMQIASLIENLRHISYQIKGINS